MSNSNKKKQYEGAVNVMKEVERKGSKASVPLADSISFNEYARQKGVVGTAEEVTKKLRTPVISTEKPYSKFSDPDQY